MPLEKGAGSGADEIFDGAGEAQVESAVVNEDDQFGLAFDGQAEQFVHQAAEHGQLLEQAAQADDGVGRQIANQLDAGRRHFGPARPKESGGQRGGQRLEVVGDLELGGRHRASQFADQVGGIGVPAGVAGDKHDAGAVHG